MKTRIQRLTVICHQGVSSHQVGAKTNGLLIDRISDCSVESEDSSTIIFRGYTKDNSIIFEVINAPVEVIYCEEI